MLTLSGAKSGFDSATLQATFLDCITLVLMTKRSTLGSVRERRLAALAPLRNADCLTPRRQTSRRRLSVLLRRPLHDNDIRVSHQD